MILYIIFIAILNINSIVGHFGNSGLAAKTHVYREDLIDFINALNNDENNLNILTPTNLEERDLDEEGKEKYLQEILWLLKKSYDAHKRALKKEPDDLGVRMYFIENPATIDEYKKYIKKKKTSKTKDEDNQKDAFSNLKKIMSELRRRKTRIETPGKRDINDDASVNNYAKNFESDKEPKRDYGKRYKGNSNIDWDNHDEEKNNWKSKKDWLLPEKSHNSKEKKRFASREKKRYESRERKSFETREKLFDSRENKPKHNWDDVGKPPKVFSNWNNDKKSYNDNDDWKSMEYKKKSYNDDNENFDKDWNSKESKTYSYPESYGNKHLRQRGHNQGRTPIPFVGKRDIYENEK